MSYNWYEAVFTVVATSHHWIYIFLLTAREEQLQHSSMAYTFLLWDSPYLLIFKLHVARLCVAVMILQLVMLSLYQPPPSLPTFLPNPHTGLCSGLLCDVPLWHRTLALYDPTWSQLCPHSQVDNYCNFCRGHSSLSLEHL